MKNLVLSFISILILSGCATLPSDPKPDTDKYAVQVVMVETRESISTSAVEDYFTAPGSQLHEYPISYAAIGETATNDQTRAVLLPESYDTIDGKVVPKEKSFNLGSLVETLIHRVEQGTASCHLAFSQKELKGFDEYTADIKMPVFSTKEFKSDLDLPLNSWALLGGLPKSGPLSNANTYFFVRIIPPQFAE